MITTETEQAVRLMKGIASQGALHLSELEGDLTQLRGLLSASVEQICSSFMSIAELTSAPEALDQPEAASESASIEARRRLDQIAMKAASVAIELQFHDMANQILGRCAGRIDGLEQMLGQLHSVAQLVESQQSELDRAREIASANEMFLSGSLELASSLRKTVAQTNLDVGDVELF